MHVSLHANFRVRAYKCIYIYIHLHTYLHMYIYTYTYTHVAKDLDLLSQSRRCVYRIPVKAKICSKMSSVRLGRRMFGRLGVLQNAFGTLSSAFGTLLESVANALATLLEHF